MQAVDVQPISATISFVTDELARGTVHYGVACDALAWTAVGSGFTTQPAIPLTGLSETIPLLAAGDSITLTDTYVVQAGDLGSSIFNDRQVSDLIMQRVEPTLALTISTITRSQQQAITVVFVWAMFAMMLSGYMMSV